jgi:ankyrin repeat protein
MQGTNGRTPLHDAINNSRLQTTSILLEYGPRLDIPDSSGVTPFDMAMQIKSFSILKVVKQAHRQSKLSLDSTGEVSTLQLRREAALWTIIKTSTLREIQARIKTSTLEEINDRPMEWQGSALHQACMARKLVVVKMLLEAGANPNSQNGFGKTPLHWTNEHDDVAIARTLIHHRAGVNLTEPSWEDALYYRSYQVATLLIESGAHISKNSPRLQNGLRAAVLCESLAAVKRLVSAGASLLIKVDGMSAIQLAEDLDLKDIMGFLLSTTVTPTFSI